MKTRTSLTHPLRIDVARVPATGGQIGMTLFPGRRDDFSAGGPWKRDLGLDLEVIRAWHPALVISLVESHEHEVLGAPDFSTVVRAFSQTNGFAWVQLPIRDGGVPDERFEADWIEAGHAARTALRAGRKVLLHCRAGLGRTGTIGARLLVELGVPPEDAIIAIRQAREHTIEKAQESYVLSCRSIDDGRPARVATPFPEELQSRFRGSLLGGAIGDALGAAFEFKSSAQIEAELGGPIVPDYRDFFHGWPADRIGNGVPTDDTAMTIALLESLFQAPPPITIELLHGRLCDMLRRGSNDVAKMFWEGAPGGACIAMLNAAARGAGPFERLDPDAGGNGAAMRAHVCGLFPERAFVAQLTSLQARLSHPHPAAVASAQTIALIAHEGFYTGKLATELPREITDPEMIAAWHAAHRNLKRGKRLPAHLRDVDMAGWNTVSAAHAIAQLYADDIETAIGIAAGSGRDTDTIASMVGAMLGAVHSDSALPARWIAGLHDRNELDKWPERMMLMATQSLELARPFVDLVGSVP